MDCMKRYVVASILQDIVENNIEEETNLRREEKRKEELIYQDYQEPQKTTVYSIGDDDYTVLMSLDYKDLKKIYKLVENFDTEKQFIVQCSFDYDGEELWEFISEDHEDYERLYKEFSDDY